jgi:DNA-binding response OmpR family regulator
MTILVADDDLIILKTIELRLKKDGYNVIISQDGKEALEKIEEASPDLIITDIQMPFLTGLELLEAVKKRYGKKIPVIILSAMGQESEVLKAFQSGADDYITKPFSPNELAMKVKKYIPGLVQM